MNFHAQLEQIFGKGTIWHHQMSHVMLSAITPLQIETAKELTDKVSPDEQAKLATPIQVLLKHIGKLIEYNSPTNNVTFPDRNIATGLHYCEEAELVFAIAAHKKVLKPILVNGVPFIAKPNTKSTSPNETNATMINLAPFADKALGIIQTGALSVAYTNEKRIDDITKETLPIDGIQILPTRYTWWANKVNGEIDPLVIYGKNYYQYLNNKKHTPIKSLYELTQATIKCGNNSGLDLSKFESAIDI